VDKASRDRYFIFRALKQIEELEFPAYKYQILDFVKHHDADNDVVAL
jgi:hypothetical protein